MPTMIINPSQGPNLYTLRNLIKASDRGPTSYRGIVEVAAGLAVSEAIEDLKGF